MDLSARPDVVNPASSSTVGSPAGTQAKAKKKGKAASAAATGSQGADGEQGARRGEDAGTWLGLDASGLPCMFPLSEGAS